MSDMFQQEAERIYNAISYHDVFLIGDKQSIKATYRKLARILHPDRVTSDQRTEASLVFDKLTDLYQAALKSLDDGRFHESKPLLVFDSATWHHEITAELHRYFDMTTGYRARSTKGATVTDSVIKIAQVPADNELLAQEVKALKSLANAGKGHVAFFPTLIDSFAVADGRKRLQANALAQLDGFVNLEEVRIRYSTGLNPLDMAWIWRRILWALGGAHEAGVLHGALVPSNILIHPIKHGVVIADWCYSVHSIDNVYPSLKAIVGTRRDWYAQHILKRQTPTTAHDVAFAARSMQFLVKGASMPNMMERYFERLAKGNEKGSAYQLLAEFDTLLERLGAPYYPRVFRSLKW